MSNWIILNPLEFSRADKYVSEGGVRVETHFSPYDVPHAVRGYFDDAKGRFHIDFKYIVPDEMLETVEENQGIAISVGKKTNRLYRINLDANRSEQKSIKERIEMLLSGLSKEEPKQNHMVARKIIEGKRHEIFSDLVPG